MARKPRIHYENAIYHVIARGNNRDNIFLEDEDKQKYLELLTRYQQKYMFSLYSYVLMDNHIHLLICVNDVPLSKIMQGLQLTYTQYFNRKYSHVGHVFQQRYKAKLCKDDAYLITLVCYIHQNPCRANIPEGLAYPWSSHQDYMKGYSRITNSQFVLSLFSDDIREAIGRYREKISESQAEPVEEAELVLNDEFSSNNTSSTEEKNDCCTAVPTGVTFEELAKQVAEEMGVAFNDLVGRCRIRRVVNARNLLIYRAVESRIYTKAELAQKLQVDPARITRGYQQVELLPKSQLDQ